MTAGLGFDTTPRVPPHSAEAETSVLGSLLLEPDVRLGDTMQLLAREMFYQERHRLIYGAMERLWSLGVPPDLVTLTEELQKHGQLDDAGGMVYLAGLSDTVPTSAYAEHYAQIVREKWMLRQVITQSGQLMRTAYEAQVPLEDVLEQASRIGMGLEIETVRSVFTADEVVAGVVSKVMGGTADPPAPTGFRDLDHQLTGGLRKATLNILAARPSMGKTAMALNIARKVAEQIMQAGDPGMVAVVSLEMPRDDLVVRMLASDARIDASRIAAAMYGKTEGMNERDFERFTNASARLAALPLLFLDDPTEHGTLRSLEIALRRQHKARPLRMVVIDYLQLMNASTSGGGENRQQEISNISRRLKLLARELNCPFLVLSQLSRAVEQRPNHRPMLSDLRESGAVEQDADVVLFIYRDEYYNKETDQQGVAEIIVGKQRHGPVGTVKLQYHSVHVRFNDLAQ